MAFTDLHEITETFRRLAFAISPEDYDGYSVRESATEHTARTQQWRRDNPEAYRHLLDKQNAERRAQRAAARTERTEKTRAGREANPDKAAVRKAKIAAYYAANPDKLKEKCRASAAWKREARRKARAAPPSR